MKFQQAVGFCVVYLIFFIPQNGAEAIEIQNDYLNLTDHQAVLYNKTDRSEKLLSSADYRIRKVFKKIHFRQIKSALEENGMKYDSESIQLVYNLNDTLSSLSSIKNQSIYLPKVEFVKSIKEGEVLKITLNAGLKSDLISMIDRSVDMVTSLKEDIPVEQFPDEFTQIRDWSESTKKVILSRTKPLDRLTLLDISGNLSIFEEQLIRFQQQNEITETDKEGLKILLLTLKERAFLLESEMSVSVPDAVPKRIISVVVKDTETGQLVDDLRVWFAPKALFFFKKEAFYVRSEDLTSPSNVEMALSSTYAIWATDPTTGQATPLTQMGEFNIKHSTDTITLVIKR